MDPIIQTTLVGISSALLAFWGTRRLNSGSIGTTDAATLWNTMNNELSYLRGRIREQDQEIDKLRARIRDCEDQR